MPSTARTATVQPTGRSLGQDWDPQSCLPRDGRTLGRTRSPPPVLLYIASTPSNVAADTSAGQTAPKYLRRGGELAKPPSTHTLGRGGPQGRNLGPLGKAGVEPGQPLALLVWFPSLVPTGWSMAMLCCAQSHRCRRSHHPCSHSWEAQGRDQDTSRYIHTWVCVVQQLPCVSVFPVGASSQLRAVPRSPAWGIHGKSCRYPVPAPLGAPTRHPASRGVPRVTQGRATATPASLTPRCPAASGGAGCVPFLPAGAAGPEQGGHGHRGGRASTDRPCAGERERCASLFYKCTNAP